MALKAYKEKRNFKKTNEPKGKIKSKTKVHLFVVQEHDATRLHYDFRLELDHVLKSWAVPKGPSLNPNDKRLAMQVEDHPYNYKDFEGTIPEGNYGAGNVIVWDHGKYHAPGAVDEISNDKELRQALKKGHLRFVLEGKKLKGEFSLVKMKGAENNAWLLIKKDDEYASKADVLKKNKSVISGKKLEARKRVSKKTPARAKRVATPEDEKPKPRQSAKRNLMRPMAAELSEEAFDDEDWIFEMKYDGYRALALLDGKGNVDLYSRNLLSFNNAYPDIAAELEKIRHSCLLDGEIVVEDEKGRSHFQLMQNYRKNSRGILKYYVFDLLELDGKKITQLPLVERKELLRTLLDKYSFKNIFYADHIEAKGKQFFAAALKNDLEGIIAKKKESKYEIGRRSDSWLKIKISKQQEAIIVGITEPKGGRSHFGSLLLGAYNDGILEYIGHCGTGFNDAALRELYQKFKPYFIKQSPFGEQKIKVNGKVQWIKPKFVCEIKFTEWTADGSMRHPVYLGLRKDKSPREVQREIPENIRKEKPAMNVDKKVRHKLTKSRSKKKDPESDENSTSSRELKIGKITLNLSNQDKIYFHADGITKGDLVNYYSEISSFILPYLKDRPQSMNRFPNGIGKPSFYQKDVDRKKIPAWLKTEKVFSESNNKNINYLVCNDKATLIYMANLGCIEINPWNSRISSPNNPDWMVIDLDPEKISFKEVVNTALEVRKVLEELGIKSYCKTSGATGLHIYVPLGAKYDYDIVKNFAQLVAQMTHERIPKTTSVLRMPAKRQGKVYIDFLQNRRGQTLAAPYSVRPKPGAPVSTPLDWKEVNVKLDPTNFTIQNILSRLQKKGDLWKPVIGKGINLEKILKSLQAKES